MYIDKKKEDRLTRDSPYQGANYEVMQAGQFLR